MKRACDRRAPTERRIFDQAYYDRFYRREKTRVQSDDEFRRLFDFVVAYLAHLEIDVSRVLDLGCGLGTWKTLLEAAICGVDYTGVEVSEYLAMEYGWELGSVVDYQAAEPFDLVICQGVLQYLDDDEADRAIVNLSRLTSAALFLEVLTREDWDYNCDQSATDGDCYKRPARWYRDRLLDSFTNCGGGLYLARDYEHYSYELDCLR